MKIVIVGGVAGGMSAATRLRRLKEDAEIVVFEKGPYVSFANCGLPYYLSGEISERENLLVQTPESLAARFQLDVRPNHEVTAVYPDEKKVEVLSDGKKWQESYDVLLLSPGAKPVRPAISGLAEAKNVYTVRNVPDIDMVMNALEEQPKKAVVVGAGFIGLEMAENLKKRGLAVSIVELAPHVLPSLDEEMAVHIQNELIKQGVHVQTKRSVTAFEHGGKQLRLDDGTTIDSDLTILSVGVQPDSTLAKMAGLETGLRGGIVVNEHYQTSDPSIYAVGDAIVVKQQITGADALISLASPANRQGRQAADNIAGIVRNNRGSLGTSVVRVFDLAAASTGLTERMAQQANLPFSVVHVSGKDHASYYPEATDILLKLIFHPKTGEIYGAQGVGAKGVDKRIDSLATAIKGQLTIFDLPELEFTYAPPFGSAKDPVNMLGYVAMNVAEGLSETIQWHELPEALAQGKILLDVRNEGELQNGAFKDALNIPLNDLRCRLAELDREKEYIVSCHSGLRSYLAERILKQAGFHVQNLDGAFALYHAVRPEDLIYPEK
ncbi:MULTISPECIES: FAD-dependent oxidoreductase [Enterococcus]|uniref:FAD-dependent oxidoreductase n=1 Tax=Enterococcus gallinarum TaxID=1353 RepID=A0ABD4HKP6_ENTGA|nr:MULTISPECIES: FAD-dependent oxidoreductase [Enterococcus]EMF0040718.1 FAD-dependent oxidoreductase [Enterococcus hirae]EMF0113603.1 FAD-dependent oxidoreductase [Enterococcus hirae]MBA0947933.1 FAD-dependent oxidoreductase [Enterococcus gallinarum]MBA0972045.1 FAD-dependent oxidoreductase [Enterococcus gallinarum]MBO1090760.1 CoA-disulfide reductase [Enterococcus hirae]